MAKIKVSFNRLNEEEEVLKKKQAEPKEWTAEEFEEGAKSFEVSESKDFEEPEEDWEENEAEIERAINEDFDRTYAGVDGPAPFYKRWWFWVALIALLALVLGVLFKTGHMPGSMDTVSTTAVATTSPFDGQVEEARDIVAPSGTSVKKGPQGWGLYQGDNVAQLYNGIASNDLGTWYIRNGLVDFDYTGYLKVNGTTYKVDGGKVDIANPVATTKAATTTASADNSEQTSVASAPQGQEFSGTEAQQDAMASAVDHINQMAFSRDWLIAQLKSDGFDENDAAWAVDHMNVDWNEQAYKKAQEYLTLTTFNHKDMVDQLVFEGFTADQAEYGATKAGL